MAIIRQNFFSSVQACCHELWTARRRCQRRFVYFIYLAAFKSKDILVVEGETFPRALEIGKKVQKVVDPKNGHVFAY